MTRRGRPLSFVNRALVEALRARPLTAREAAAELRLSLPEAEYRLSRLRSLGYLAPAVSAEGAPIVRSTRTRPAVALTAAPAPAPAAEGAQLHFVMGLMVRTGRPGQ